MRLPSLRLIVCALTAIAFCTSPAFGQAAPAKALEPEHFNAANADAAADPCEDFFQYADGKWVAAHPIPADQSGWGVGRVLQLWNETLLRETLQKTAENQAGRTPDEQKVGDYYHACMDEKTLNARAASWLKPELKRIARIKSKSEIAAEVAHLHQTNDGAYAGGDNQSPSAILGFSGVPGYDDASHSVAQFDQAGMGMPGRSFYLDQDDKSKEIRAKYVQHVKKMLMLAGEAPQQAQADANVVLGMETQM